MKTFYGKNLKIDHIAIAVLNLEEAIFFYRDLLGFKLINKREIEGKFSGMISAELTAENFSIVLVQGTTSESQVCKYIDKYGPGVQHVALLVDDVRGLRDKLSERGMRFSTSIIKGKELIQVFTTREETCGMMFEFIQRSEAERGFELNNIQNLFNQLENADAF